MAVFNGTSGNDVLQGTTGPDLIYGYDGNDTIIGGFGNDSMYGGNGDDVFVLNSSAGVDYYDGGSGTDIIAVSNVSAAFSYVDIGIGSMSSIEGIVNNDYKPVYIATAGSLDLTGVTLINIAGFKGTATNDYMTGEAVYNSLTSTWSGIKMWGYAGNDQMTGSSYGDTIDGGDGTDQLFGRGGNDTLIGGLGADQLTGGVANDTLTGGAGADQFIFGSGNGVDTLTDYVDGSDKFVMGANVSSVNLYNYNGSALLEINGGTTYVIVSGVSANSIDSSDFLWA